MEPQRLHATGTIECRGARCHNFRMQKTPGRLRLLKERPRDDAAIEEMTAAAFGPDRFHKTVYRLREDVPPIKDLCFVCLDQKNRLVASIRNWPVLINEKWPAVMLGPLSIAPELRGLGYGKALMWHSMAQSRMQGHSRIILVGDPEYYNQFGFRRDLALHLQLPGWFEERRFLALELVAGSMIGVHGMVGKALMKKKVSRRKKRS
jgi:predicted N-acetyltransferase YhbS